MKMVALIPARAGSRRIPGKNTKLLGGHPLIAYTIAAAQQSGVFTDVIVATDDKMATDWAHHLGAALAYRPNSNDDEPDIAWLSVVLKNVCYPESFAILRPTSPFRTAAMIQRAFEKFRRTPDVDSLRAVQPVTEHPGKMWTWKGNGYPIEPLLDKKHPDGTPWHSSPTQSLPTVFVQNSSLEMAWTRTVTQLGSIAGKKVLPFFTDGYEGFSIDYPSDWDRAEQLVRTHPELLPHVQPTPCS
jgi:CMP-N,N'-diacetyllegionaminic acid synthase